jgi:hypothetical protein
MCMGWNSHFWRFSLLIVNYFCFLENKLDTYNFRVNMVRDFNTSGFDWKYGMFLPNSLYYSKLKGDGFTHSRAFLSLARALILSAAVIYLTDFFSNLCDLCIATVTLDLQSLRIINFPPPWLSIFIYHLSLVFKITYICPVNSPLGITHCFIIFCQLMADLVYVVPPMGHSMWIHPDGSLDHLKKLYFVHLFLHIVKLQKHFFKKI